jgi:hypothetical protein
MDTLLPTTHQGKLDLLELMASELPEGTYLEPYGLDHYSVFRDTGRGETELTPMPMTIDRALYFITGLLRGAK